MAQTNKTPQLATVTARDGADTRYQENSEATAVADGEATRLGAGDQVRGGPTAVLNKVLLDTLQFMRSNPTELERKPQDMMNILQAYIDSDGQGSANEVKGHEACIAIVLERFGFVRAPRGVYPTTDGLYYWYQLKGSQRSGDFLVFEISGGTRVTERVLDAKHSNGMSIYLNDGTFEIDTLYIISFTKTLARVKGQRKCPREQVCFIGLGQHIFSEKDRSVLERWRATLRELNKVAEDTDHLRVYARSANQYDCHRFTPEFTENCWSLLSPSL